MSGGGAEDAGAHEKALLKQMLPRYNPQATCVEEVFCFDQVLPLHLLDDDSTPTGTRAEPLLSVLMQNDSGEVDVLEAEKTWGVFVASTAKRVMQERGRQIANAMEQEGSEDAAALSGQLSLPQLARLLKVLKFLCLLLQRQKRQFRDQQEVRDAPRESRCLRFRLLFEKEDVFGIGVSLRSWPFRFAWERRSRRSS